jgi:periplasmic divalent cation tolerance protein
MFFICVYPCASVAKLTLYMNQILLVITNLPDRATAERVADALVTEGVAACVNILAACSSVYRWEGKLNHTEEVPLLIKTTHAAYPQLEAALRKLHPYELPELLAVPVTAGLPEYLNWVESETRN